MVDTKAVFCLGYLSTFKPFDMATVPENARPLAEKIQTEVQDARRRLIAYTQPRQKFFDEEGFLSTAREGEAAFEAAREGAEHCMANPSEAICQRRSAQAKECREALFLPF